MSDEFVYARPDGELIREPVSLAKAMEVARERIKTGEGPFTLSQDGEAFKTESRKDVLERLEKRLRNGEPGPKYRVRKVGGDVVFRIQEVKSPPIIDTNGNDNADKFWSWVVREFPEYRPRFAGAYVCKHISGSSSMNQHSYGNAVDIFFDSAAHQGVVYAAVKRGQAPVPVAHAISDRRIWSPSSGERAYGGDTHYHLHVDFNPQYSGPCGVRP